MERPCFSGAIFLSKVLLVPQLQPELSKEQKKRDCVCSNDWHQTCSDPVTHPEKSPHIRENERRKRERPGILEPPCTYHLRGCRTRSEKARNKTNIGKDIHEQLLNIERQVHQRPILDCCSFFLYVMTLIFIRSSWF